MRPWKILLMLRKAFGAEDLQGCWAPFWNWEERRQDQFSDDFECEIFKVKKEWKQCEIRVKTDVNFTPSSFLQRLEDMVEKRWTEKIDRVTEFVHLKDSQLSSQGNKMVSQLENLKCHLTECSTKIERFYPQRYCSSPHGKTSRYWDDFTSYELSPHNSQTDQTSIQVRDSTGQAGNCPRLLGEISSVQGHSSLSPNSVISAWSPEDLKFYWKHSLQTRIVHLKFKVSSWGWISFIS